MKIKSGKWEKMSKRRKNVRKWDKWKKIKIFYDKIEFIEKIY